MNEAIDRTVYQQRISVDFEYPVHFVEGVFATENTVLRDVINRRECDRRHRVQVFVDSGVVAAMPDVMARIEDYFAAYPESLDLVCPPEVVPGGEEAKNSRDAAERVMESIADQHLCRQSFVVAVGGGSALDIIGLAASLVHRGVRVVRIPTTVLAQGDSGVGVKNGIDAYGVKNFAGTFAPPFAVLNDATFLDTLADRYWIGGISEAYKVAIIQDAAFFDDLRQMACRLRHRDQDAIRDVIKRSAILHLDHIAGSGDPFEFGAARPLDFGHWCAHRIEVLSGYEIAHGQAVAIGMALDSFCAWQLALLSDAELVSILDAMVETGLPIWARILERKTSDGESAILRGLVDFQEHLGGRLHVTLPDGIGAKCEVHELDRSMVLKGIKYLESRKSKVESRESRVEV